MFSSITYLKIVAGLAEALGKFDLVSRCWVKIATIKKTSKCLTTAGMFLSMTGRHTEAEIYFREALEVNPYFSPALFNFGYLRQKMGCHEEAIDLFSSAILSNPNLDRAYYGRGLSFTKLFEYEKACENFRKTIKLQPFCPHGYYQLCFVLKELNQNSEIIKTIQTLHKFEPQVAFQLVNELNIQAGI
ncbi:MAG: hypothetical protein CBC42_00550 [Betaproteobacteria bacterium TMED82]|nr:MAG: hypothetical protein CBC42_00550 [Betaproteobacteria bacterium TMED82]|tara:strand:+ start:35105 stop:35668 length:564 start_codon:yes stop_codon:yes gene_type:complete